jgi:class 3 adenylate cyclase
VDPDTVERRLAAILSADVVGYSRLMAQDEMATLKTLGAYRDAIGGLVRQHGGRVVDAVGDNLLAEFPSVVDAVACAAAIQGELGARNAGLVAERKMQFRMGIQLGDVVVEGERIYGDGVNVAARLEALAEPGGICISGTVYDQVRHKLSHVYEGLGEHALKNVPDPVRVYRVKSTAGDGRDDASELTVPGFAGRPAIAVLAFDNLSGDPEQEYFADGIAEDLITCLSGVRLFPVIARNSSFVYKGKSMPPPGTISGPSVTTARSVTSSRSRTRSSTASSGRCGRRWRKRSVNGPFARPPRTSTRGTACSAGGGTSSKAARRMS